jgi:hypothetical protein
MSGRFDPDAGPIARLRSGAQYLIDEALGLEKDALDLDDKAKAHRVKADAKTTQACAYFAAAAALASMEGKAGVGCANAEANTRRFL